MLQLMPSPRWKLVVDVGQADPDITVGESATAVGLTDACNEEEPKPSRDSRIDQVISLLGEFMPSDPDSPLATYLPGFMSLRLMLLRPSKSVEEEEIVRTILGSYSSYSGSGKTKQDIALNLAQDFMFLNQQSQTQQLFHGLGQSMMSFAPMSNSACVSFFSLPPSGTSSSSASFQNSPALAPIVPIPLLSGGKDSISIVST